LSSQTFKAPQANNMNIESFILRLFLLCAMEYPLKVDLGEIEALLKMQSSCVDRNLCSYNNIVIHVA